MLNLLLALAGIAALICTVARLIHRYFIYLPDRTRCAPEAVGLTGVREVELTAKDGVELIAWYLPAKGHKPTLLYFTGVGGNVATRAEKIKLIQAAGYGVFMLNYRRYGGSGGRPSEAKNVADATVAYDWLRASGLSADEIVAYGESLGTGVATQLTLQRPVKSLVLEAPFTSIPEVGKQLWWFLPLELIMVDQYRTIEHIRDVKVPLLILHGARDTMIPVVHARKVYAASNQPKSLAIMPRGGHSDLFEHGAFECVREFLGERSAAPMPRRLRPVEPVREQVEAAA